MNHDHLCEMNRLVAPVLWPNCKCTTRAYWNDPIPDDELPIYEDDRLIEQYEARYDALLGPVQD